MKQARVFRIAILSVTLGICGTFFALARGRPLLGLALLWGLLTTFSCYLAIRILAEHPKWYCRKALAIIGLCLGLGCVFVSSHALLTSPTRPRAGHRASAERHTGAVRPNEGGQLSPGQRAWPERAPATRPGGMTPAEPPASIPQRWVPAPPRARTLPSNIALDNSLTNFSSNLPLILIDTGTQPIYSYLDTPATARVIAPEGGRARIVGHADYQGRALLELHGTSTLRLPKKAYNFHTTDEKTNQVKAALLGLPKEEDWILLAPYEDKSMMRDVLAYELCNRMGRYAPRTRYVEVFVNTSGQPMSWRDYAGVYVLVEKIKRGKYRVDIEKLDAKASTEPEITGGYIFKRDHPDEGGGFYTRNGGPYFMVYPKTRDIKPAQRAWLTGYMNAFENALAEPWFTDPNKGYAAYLDVDSFIDAHWLIELSKNVDGFRYSAFLTKERDGKLKLEPPWDWNRSFGNADYHGGWDVESWYWLNLRSSEICWYRRLQQDPEFLQRCNDRWFELRQSVFDPDQISARMEQLASELGEAQRRNFQRWPILGQQVTCNYYVGNSFGDEVRWLKNWINLRIAWIDRQLRPPPRIVSGELASGGQFVAFEPAPGDIYYTLNGSDPRAPGGDISSRAQCYTNRFVLGSDGKLKARIRYRDSTRYWSAPVYIERKPGAAARKETGGTIQL